MSEKKPGRDEGRGYIYDRMLKRSGVPASVNGQPNIWALIGVVADLASLLVSLSALVELAGDIGAMQCELEKLLRRKRDLEIEGLQQAVFRLGKGQAAILKKMEG